MKRYPVDRFWVGVILVLHLIISFYGQLKYRYLVAPGEDMGPHLEIIQKMLAGQFDWTSIGYPYLYHLLVALISKTLAISYPIVTAWLTPLLLVVAGLMVWFMTKRLFGPKVALFSYLLYALVSLQPLQTAIDGGVPNILSGHVILPLVILAYCLVWLSRSRIELARHLLWFGLSLLILSLSHHLSTLIGLVVLILSAGPLLIWKLWQLKRSFWSVIAGAAIWLALLLAAYLAITKVVIFQPALSLAEGFITLTGSFPFIQIDHVNVSPVWQIIEYSQTINGLIFQAGVFGTVALLWQARRQPQLVPAAVVITIWFWSLFIGSRFSWVGEPTRLARDAALPATIAAGYLLALTWQQKILSRATAAILISLISWLVLTGFIEKTIYQTNFNRMVYLSAADQSALDYIRAHPELHPVYIWDYAKNFHHLGEEEFRAGLIQPLPAEIEATAILRNTSRGCIMTGYFQPGVWPDRFADRSTVTRLGEIPGVESRLLMADPQKIWYILCKR